MTLLTENDFVIKSNSHSLEHLWNPTKADSRKLFPETTILHFSNYCLWSNFFFCVKQMKGFLNNATRAHKRLQNQFLCVNGDLCFRCGKTDLEVVNLLQMSMKRPHGITTNGHHEQLTKPEWGNYKTCPRYVNEWSRKQIHSTFIWYLDCSRLFKETYIGTT